MAIFQIWLVGFCIYTYTLTSLLHIRPNVLLMIDSLEYLIGLPMLNTGYLLMIIQILIILNLFIFRFPGQFSNTNSAIQLPSIVENVILSP